MIGAGSHERRGKVVGKVKMVRTGWREVRRMAGADDRVRDNTDDDKGIFK